MRRDHFRMRVARKDSNASALEEAAYAYAKAIGVRLEIADLSGAGRGVPDALWHVGGSDGRESLVEYKAGKAKTDPPQDRFRERWPSEIPILRTREDARALVARLAFPSG